MLYRRLAVLLVSCGHYLFAPAASAQEAASDSQNDAILILDASNSMWGQIDGVNKIVIAKDVVEGLVRSLPEQQRLGLVAYGHRRKGDCTDIQTLAEVGAQRSNLIDGVRQLSPVGMTPLSRSVEHAATELNYTQDAATVILVSDGLETCDVDPCALAALLEENGLDFTVHVVGFDVTEEERAGLQCIAEETGGAFLSADNARELSDALIEVAVATQPNPQPEDAPQTVALKATMLRNGPDIQSELAWTIVSAEDNDTVFSANDTGYAETEILPGAYVARAVWSGWHSGEPKSGETAFTIEPGKPAVVAVAIDLGIPVTLTGPASVPEGSTIDVTWSGPDDLGGYVTVNKLDDGPREFIYSSSAAQGRERYRETGEDAALDTDGDGDFDQDDEATVTIGAPSYPGQFELRYVLDDPRLILARQPIEITDSDYTLTAPESVPISTGFSVDWQGPQTGGDFLTIVPAGTEAPTVRGPIARLGDDPGTVELTSPSEPGDYEVRYILANGYTLYPGMQQVVQASAPIRVEAVAAELTAPASAVGGSTIEVGFSGPEGWEDDFLSTIESGATALNRDSTAQLRNADSNAMTVELVLPAIPGDYEIAYFVNPGQKLIQRRPLEVTAPQASVDAPDTVKAGESFEVSYRGNAFSGDRVVVVPVDYADSGMWGVTARYGFFAEEGGTIGTVSPYPIANGPGEYEARYVTGKQNQILARDRFTVVE